MGACNTTPAIQVDETTDAFDLQILQDKLNSLFEFKILLLGAGESGKSTIIKQLKAVHKKKSEDDLSQVANSLHQNVIDCVTALVEACKNFGYELEADDRATVQSLHTIKHGDRISPELGEKILKLFHSESLKKAKERENEFWLLDACDYYMENLKRFTEIDYVPTDEDVVRARIRTTGIVETSLEQKIQDPKEGEPDRLSYKVVDVGGQRNERKKWINCFSDVKAVLFIVNLAGYDRVLFEDSSKIRMKESLELFKDVTHQKMFKDTPIFLFLNKKDLFEALIRTQNISKCFPEYTGDNSLAESLKYVITKFKEQLPTGKDVEVQVVTGVWKRDIKCAFEEVKKTLYDMNKPNIEKEKAAVKKMEQKKRGKMGGKGKKNK